MSATTKAPSITGTVVKRCSKYTVRIATKITKVHPIYKKRYSQMQYFLAHDPEDNAEVGSMVTIVACRPISKQKHWCIKQAN